MKTNKTGIFTKLISCFLCTAITLQLGLALTVEKVSAAGYIGASLIDEGYFNISITPEGDSAIFRITPGNTSKYLIKDDTDKSFEFDKIGSLFINGNPTVYVDADIEIPLIRFVDEDKGYFQIDKGYTLTIPEPEAGTVFNIGSGYMFVIEGTLNIYKFLSSDFFNIGSIYISDGTIEADDIDISSINLSSTYKSKLIPKDSFKIGNQDFNGTVVAQPDTIINSGGGSFELRIGDARKTITGQVSNKTAIELMDDPKVTLENVPSKIFVGEDVETILKGCIKKGNPGYTSTPYLEYRESGESEYTTTVPSTPNRNYNVRVVAPAAGSYVRTESDYFTFTYDYYPYTDVRDSDGYFTLEGVDENGKYIIEDTLKVTPAEGFQIACSHGDNAHKYSDQLELSEREITNGAGGVDYNVMFSFKKTSGEHVGAQTNDIDADTLMPGFDDLVFETEAPEIYGLPAVSDMEEEVALAAGDDGLVAEPVSYIIPISDGDVIKEDELTVVVEDKTLNSVTVDGTTYDRSDFYYESDSGIYYFSTDPYTSTPGKSKKISVSATDEFNKTTSLSFTLKSPELGNVTATVSVPTTIYAGDSYEPTVTVKGTDEQYVAYLFYDGEEELQPTDAGTHTVFASVYFEEYEESIETEPISYTIIKRTPTLSLTIPEEIYAGEDYEIKVNTDSDGDVSKRFYYDQRGSNVVNDTVFIEEPDRAGKYMVVVHISETDFYEAAEITEYYTVNHKRFTATVSVDDITYGGTVNPVLDGVPEDYDGEEDIIYEYKLRTDPDTSYSTTVPEAAGTYDIRVTFPETGYYLSSTCSDSFTINGIEFEPKVTVSNINVGGTVTPVLEDVPEDYHGNITYKYKSSKAEDSTYTTTAPKAAGVYTVMAVLDPTDKYSGTSCTSTFSISKIAFEPTLTISDIYVGGKVNPVLDGVPDDYDGGITYQYKLSTAANYSTTVPSDEGEYEVLAVLPETDKYFGISCTNTFKISKNELKASVSVADIYVGEKISPVVTTEPADYQGLIVFEYKERSADDSAYSTAVPKAAGEYMIRATLYSTKEYYGTTCTDTFRIIKKKVTASVNVASITVGQTPRPVVNTESDGKVTFEYKSSSANDSAYTTTVPTAAGNYTVRATIAETDKYLGITCTAEFTISLNQAKNMELSVPSIYYGQTVTASFNTDSDGEVTIMYKSATAPDSAYSTSAPTKVGNYVARATVTETDSYEAISVTTSFAISYLEAPAPAFVPSGKEGKNGYYISDVVLNAPSGYLISKSLGTGYSTSIPYTEGLSTIYLKRIDDNALTGSITITQPKIDKTAPVISSSSGTMFVDSTTVTVSDENLVSLAVNGSPVTITNGTATITLTRPESGFVTYTITAEDEAGNISTIEITLMAEWLKDKTIPEGNVVSLNAGEEYFLDEGKWIVSIVKEDGTIVEGTTIYNGNQPFYVSESGNYIFTRVETD